MKQQCACSRDPSSFTGSQNKPEERCKPTDKESGFESSPSSPRPCSSLEPGQHQCLYTSQKELRHQRCTPANECVSLDSFKFIKKLGSGGYGSVVLVEKRRGRDRGALFALKMTSLNRAALVERDILPRLQHVPYTTDLAYAFFNATIPKAFLALPYAIGKDLFSLAGPSKTPGYLRRMFLHCYPRYLGRIKIVLAELSVALRFLHENNILYRDLKLENILVHGDGHLRLADFGLSRHFEPGESTRITGKTGTPDYMAPEVLRSGGTHIPHTSYSYEADMWGLGVIAFELIVGQLPFRGREVSDLEMSILNDFVEVPSSFMQDKFTVLGTQDRISVLAALSFVRALLQRMPDHRLDDQNLPLHPFFQDLDWDAINTGRHSDPPFDIRRIIQETPADDEVQRIPSAFTGAPSSKKQKKDKPAGSSSNGYDSPSKYKNYHFCGGQFGWYLSNLEELRGHNSYEDLPDNVTVVDDDLETSMGGGTVLEEVPGLMEFERDYNDSSFTSAGSSASSSASLVDILSEAGSTADGEGSSGDGEVFTDSGCPLQTAEVPRWPSVEIISSSGGAAPLEHQQWYAMDAPSTAVFAQTTFDAAVQLQNYGAPMEGAGTSFVPAAVVQQSPRSPEEHVFGDYSPASPEAAPQTDIELFPRVRVREAAPSAGASSRPRPDLDSLPGVRRAPRRLRTSATLVQRPLATALAPITEESTSPTTRLQKRRAAAATFTPSHAAAMEIADTQLPPRKRRRFLQQTTASPPQELNYPVQLGDASFGSDIALRSRTRAAAAAAASRR